MYRWLKEENIVSLPEALFRVIERNPGRVALDFPYKRFTYKKTGEWVKKFTVLFEKLLGSKDSGERIAVFMPNLPQFVFCYYAIPFAGGIFVPVDFSSIATELRAKPARSIKLKEDVIEGIRNPILDATPKILIIADMLWPIFEQLGIGDKIEKIIVTSPADFLSFPFSWLYERKAKKEGKWIEIPQKNNVFFLKDLLSGISLDKKTFFKEHPYPDINSIAQLQYTGGTTGLSKGVMLSHKNVITNALQSREALGNFAEQGSTVIGTLPLFHIYGLTVCLNITFLALEGTLVLVPIFDPRKILKTIVATGATLWPGVNIMFKTSLAARKIPSLPNLICISGAGWLKKETKEKFEAATGAQILEGYGLSEASPVVSFLLPKENKIGSVGRPLPLTEVKIIDLDNNQELGPDQTGEIIVRGAQVMKGYYRNDSETQEALKDGWLYTGDIGKIDSDGFLYILDRKKDMVKRGNVNVYCRQIEEIILKQPGVKKCVIIGRKGRKEEMLIAFVVQEKTTTKELTFNLKSSLPSLWFPEEIIQVSEEQFNEWENILEKIKKRKVREYYEKNFADKKQEEKT